MIAIRTFERLTTMNQFILRFSIAGVPIEIYPICWLLLAFLGGAFSMESMQDLPQVLTFVLAGFICLLAHELGHALVGRKLCGGQPRIELSGLGGVTYNPSMRNTERWNIFAMVLAGPVAGLLPALFALLVLGVMAGSLISAGAVGLLFVYGFFLQPSEWMLELAAPALSLLYEHESIHMLITPFIWVGFFWSFFNLLPIFPLDGSKLLSTLIKNAYLTAQIGMVICVAVAIYFITNGSIWNGALCCYLGYVNWQYLVSFKRNRQ